MGSMTGQLREIADIMERGKSKILSVQETRWKGIKTKELSKGYKLNYSGLNKAGRNGVRIIVNGDLKSCVVNVQRKSDQIMSTYYEVRERQSTKCGACICTLSWM